jgi:hypothetical protein
MKIGGGHRRIGESRQARIATERFHEEAAPHNHAQVRAKRLVAVLSKALFARVAVLSKALLARAAVLDSERNDSPRATSPRQVESHRALQLEQPGAGERGGALRMRAICPVAGRGLPAGAAPDLPFCPPPLVIRRRRTGPTPARAGNTYQKMARQASLAGSVRCVVPDSPSTLFSRCFQG